jgi:hypothetical protein
MDIKEQLTLESLQAKQLIEKNQMLSMLMEELKSLQDRIRKLESSAPPAPGTPAPPIDFGAVSE